MQALILTDAVVTLTAMGSDDGTSGPSVGNAISLCVDRVRVQQTRDLVDASCEQDAFPAMRIRKLGWEVQIETKLEKGGTFLTALQNSTTVVVEVDITASGASVNGVGIISNVEWEYGNPSTLSLTIQPYGAGLTVTAS
jgi:hypothetical protein